MNETWIEKVTYGPGVGKPFDDYKFGYICALLSSPYPEEGDTILSHPPEKVCVTRIGSKETIELTESEFRLLMLFRKKPNTIIPVLNIYACTHATGPIVATRQSIMQRGVLVEKRPKKESSLSPQDIKKTVEVLIRSLRKKLLQLEVNTSRYEIVTVKGLGYRLIDKRTQG